MMIFAIDPGDVQTAYCMIDDKYKIHAAGKVDNDELLSILRKNAKQIDHVVVEMIASYGMAVGRNVFETCVMIGRIEQVANSCRIEHSRVYRQDEKLCICHDSRAKDSNIRAALIDRFAKHDKKRGTGTKFNPDHFYGISRDMWSAFAVGTVYLDGINGLFTRKGDA